MELKQQGITIDCRHCCCAGTDGCGGFDVTVPLGDSESGISGMARLHCTVTPVCHHVELVEWRDAEFHAMAGTTKVHPRIAAALDFVAARRICGNQHICPARVVRVVEKHGAG